MMKNIQILCMLTFCTVSSNALATSYIPEYTSQEIDYKDIYQETLAANYNRTIDMSTNEVFKTVYKNVDRNWFSSLPWINTSLDQSIYASNKTDETKSQEVLNIIATSKEPYSRNDISSALKVKIEHSVAYDTTFISWNDNDLVKSYNCAYEISRRSYDRVWKKWVTYTDYIYRQITVVPDYEIYRVINNRPELITKIKGFKRLDLSNHSFSINPYGFVDWKSIYKDTYKDSVYHSQQEIFYDYFSDAETRPHVFLDLMSINRNQGDTLSYKIIAKNGAHRWGNCGYNDIWTTTVTADTDGDLRMDFIPDEVYDSLFTKLNPWFVPVVSTTLF